MNVTFMANIIRKTVITRNPQVSDRISKTETFNQSYSTSASFKMTTKTGNTVEVTIIADRNSEYTKFVTADYSLYLEDGTRKGHKVFHYSYDMYESNAFNRIVNSIKHDFQLDTVREGK